MEPKIAITGANGFVGLSLRRFLNNNDISTVSLTRKKIRLSKLDKCVVFSDLDQHNIARKLQGCSAFVHLIGTGMQTKDVDYASVNVELTKKAIALCKKAQIRKFVYISGLGVKQNTTFGYFISKLRAEQQIVNSGLNYTILRASYIIGNRDPMTKNLKRQMTKGRILVPGSGAYRLQPVSVDDACKVIFEATTRPRMSNKIVDLVGPRTISFLSFVKKFAKNTKIVKLDLEQAYSDALNFPKKATYSLDDLNILVGDFVGDYKKLERLCGFRLKTPDEFL
ncbi:MAG: NAD(P)H-binding protein [Candidatus Nitrosotenuis sp.]